MDADGATRFADLEKLEAQLASSSVASECAGGACPLPLGGCWQRLWLCCGRARAPLRPAQACWAGGPADQQQRGRLAAGAGSQLPMPSAACAPPLSLLPAAALPAQPQPSCHPAAGYRGNVNDPAALPADPAGPLGMVVRRPASRPHLCAATAAEPPAAWPAWARAAAAGHFGKICPLTRP
jgi:hypothetical protein